MSYEQPLGRGATAWAGWVIFAACILMVVGLGLMVGSAVARILGTALAIVNMIAQFTWIGAAPWWSLIGITLSIIVIYALMVHGNELGRD